MLRTLLDKEFLNYFLVYPNAATFYVLQIIRNIQYPRFYLNVTCTNYSNGIRYQTIHICISSIVCFLHLRCEYDLC